MRIKHLALSVIIFLTCFSLSAQENRTDASGLKQGPWIKKYANGNILYQGAFKDDKPVGEFKRYYEDGTPKAVLSYDESGLKAGAVFFHPDGKRAAEGTYIDKKKEGVWKYYSAKHLHEPGVCRSAHQQRAHHGAVEAQHEGVSAIDAHLLARRLEQRERLRTVRSEQRRQRRSGRQRV
jgi:hypothetical protein